MSRTNAGPSAFLDPAAPTLATVIDRLAAAEPDHAPARGDELRDPHLGPGARPAAA